MFRFHHQLFAPLLILLAFTFVLLGLGACADATPPYPQSTVITGVSFDLTTLDTRAPGSDNWPITWADDGHQYTSWGDGGGFGGTNNRGRTSLGFARIDGPWNDYVGTNIWGGVNAQNPAQFGGKSYGILSVGGILYAWWGPGSGTAFPQETRVLRSRDHGRSWTRSEWAFTDADNLYAGSFLNFGQDYRDNRDDYVYTYFPRGKTWTVHKPGKIDLARVPRDRIMVRSSYEFFAGINADGRAAWTADLLKRQPVFQDPNGLRTVSVTYNPQLKRYLLTVDHTRVNAGNLGIFEAPEPWGPWRTVAYYSHWNGFSGTISYYFAPKWFSDDGKEFSMVFTQADSWNTIRGTFQTSR